MATSRSSVRIKTTFGLRYNLANARPALRQLHKVTHIRRHLNKVCGNETFGPILTIWSETAEVFRLFFSRCPSSNSSVQSVTPPRRNTASRHRPASVLMHHFRVSWSRELIRSGSPSQLIARRHAPSTRNELKNIIQREIFDINVIFFPCLLYILKFHSSVFMKRSTDFYLIHSKNVDFKTVNGTFYFLLCLYYVGPKQTYFIFKVHIYKNRKDIQHMSYQTFVFNIT